MLSKEEEKVLSALDVQKAWAHVEFLSDLDKTSGTEGERKAHEYVQGKLKEYGVPYRAFTFESLISHPQEASIRITSPSAEDMFCATHAFSGSTPEGGAEGDLVYMPVSYTDIHTGIEGLVEEYRKLGVRGKVALIRGVASPPVVWAAEQAGALAQIHINGEEVIHEMIVTTVWGTPTPESSARIPRMPAVSVKKSDGDKLLALLEKGSVRVRIRAKVDTRWRTLPITVAQIPGAEEAERFMLVHGHMDSWYVGTTDNSTGNAVLLELARLVWNHRKEVKRGVRIAWWSGHSTGRYSGSTWYADHFFEELERDCFLSQNIDSPGVKGATDLGGGGLMGTMEFIRQALMDATGSNQVRANPFYMRAGDQSFYGIGIPSVAVRAYVPKDSALAGKWIGGSGGGWWWHSAQDTLDKGDKDHLLRDARMNALALFRSLNTTVLPFNFVPVADQYSAIVTEIQGRVPPGAFDLTPVLDKIRELKAEAEKLNSVTGKAQGAPREKLYEVNRLLMEASKILTSTFYTYAGRYEQDPAFTLPHVPALQDAKKLSTVDLGGDEARFLKTRLVREMNKVNHQLNGSISRIREAIKIAG